MISHSFYPLILSIGFWRHSSFVSQTHLILDGYCLFVWWLENLDIILFLAQTHTFKLVSFDHAVFVLESIQEAHSSPTLRALFT